VIVNVCEGPGHDEVPLLKVGVTVIVPVIGAVVVFVVRNAGILPVPDATSL